MNATSKLVKAWESKNARNAAKAGGISMMALSLAACGGSSTTTTTTATDTATDTATTTPVVVQGLTFALSSSADVLDPNSATAASTSTAGDDTFRAGTDGDFTSADIINGGDGNDTLTATVAEGGTDEAIKPMLTSVENVKVTMTAEAAGADSVQTFNFTDSTGLTSFEVVNIDDADVIVTGITVATTVTSSGVAGVTADSVNTITLSGLSTATDGGQDAYTVNLNDADLGDLDIAGVEAITLNASGKAVDVADLSANALESLTITGGVVDATVTTEAVVIGSGTAVAFAGLEAADAATIDASDATSAVTVTMASDDDDDLVATGGAGKFTLTMTGTDDDGALTVTSGAGGLAVTLVGGDNAATATSMALVNVTGSAVVDTVDISSVPNPTDISATAADESKTVNATVSTGDGNDVITIDAGVVNVDAGAGNDTLVVTTTGAITGAATEAVDLIDLGAGTDTISTADATINATDKTWVGYIKNSEAIKVTATAEKTVDLDLLANTNIVALSSSAHTATGAAANVDAGGAGSTGQGSVGGDALDFTGSNANSVLTLSADLVGQAGQGLLAASDDAGDTGGDGGVGLDLNVSVDNGNNRATITLVDDTDITGGAGGAQDHASATGGDGGIGLDANQVDYLNIILSATDATADAVAIAGGAGGTDASGTDGSAGGDISVAANATITLTETFSGTATAAKMSSINLNNIVGSNVTVDASGLTGAVTIDSLQGNTTVTLGSGADTFGGAEGGIDTVDLGAGNDTVNHTGGAVDVYTGGTGIDTYKVAANHDDSTDAFKITDFARGSGGDVISVDVSTVDGSVAGLVDNLDLDAYIEGSVGTVTANDSAVVFASNKVNVLTGSGFANYAAAETELALEAGGALTDIAVVFFNTTNGVAEMYLSDTTANATNDHLLVTFTDITAVTQLEDLATNNFTDF